MTLGVKPLFLARGRPTSPTRLVLALVLLLSACKQNLSPQDMNITGMVPPLSLGMMDVNTSQPVSAASFKGKVTLLYFGYTNCPDVCPATLYNVDKILRNLGGLASQVNVLFVTVDPDRDTPVTLAQYVSLFGPNITGLRGTADQLYALARRYRVVFSVTKPTASTPYAVTHSAAIYVFSAQGRAQFLIAGLDTDQPDISGITADLRQLILQQNQPGWLDWLKDFISG